MSSIDQTHDPDLTSWVSSANAEGTDFPVQNLPWCRFATSEKSARPGVGIGDQILDVQACAEAGLLDEFASLFAGGLNSVMAAGATERLELRRGISRLLSADDSTLRDRTELHPKCLVDQSSAEFLVPCEIGDYTDFYASVFHATNVGSMFRPDNPLLPNYKHLPVGYHGRASSVVVSGTDVRRPTGQQAPAETGAAPGFGPSKLLDYELEVGAYIAVGNDQGTPIPIDRAEDHLFGLSLVNDWSARDLQKWEYQPLGPFLAKSFATSVAPWIVTREALTPFRCGAFERASGDPQPHAYLDSPGNRESGGVDLQLEVWLSSSRMREEGVGPHRLSRGSLRNMYWTMAQMLTHHASNGCNMRPGDLIASGTVSGPERDSRGCLLELTWDGDATNPLPGTQRTPVTLPTGEERRFLADGDEVTIVGFCEADGYRRIGFGQCCGTIVAAGCDQ